MNCSLRGKVFDIVSTQKFDHFIMTIIMLSTITMAMSYFEPISNWDETLEYIDFVWSGIFFLEMILKMLGLGFAQYFRKHWNKFDFFIVMSSSADVLFTRFLGIGGGGAGGIDIKTFRVGRIARMVKLIKHNQGLANIFGALILSIPSLGNVGSILFLNLYVYAVMGMNLFSDVSVEGGCGPRDCTMIDERSNFQTFGSSMLTLFRTVTGESWNGIMHDLGSAGHSVATPYFVR